MRLTELAYGRFPEETRDLEKRAAWIEKAEAKKRLAATVRAAVVKNCYSVLSYQVREALKPIMLPDSIEDCLSMPGY